MAGTEESVVVTGGGQGVGRAIVEHLLELGRRVMIVELRADGLGWADEHIAVGRIGVVPGDAGADDVARTAAERAAALGRLTGWVNNAAVFPDAWLHEAGGAAVAELVRMNLQPALAGAAAAVAAFRAAGTGGAIVNVSSHQAQRSVRGALPYAVAKAAIEGLTRSLAVDYGPWGIRVNAVALGSIVTDRLARLRVGQPEEVRRATDAQLAELHPLGRAGEAAEVARVVAHLLSTDASFVSGAVILVDGGRAAQGADPERRQPG
ncbi:NAD(P)-dependent dehydrogenase, short-chain alcohol dehydrogenase family [Pseudonocardia thermophila]|uniref:NAD(P)-dependent dehydrogenase, short-chain alcohol dehydrogenase family n=1 Tax=Pseudonocardia thermophila TaxID=1848 RepID=A0A1M6P278_PSETH|nr:SDR family oxidoreductase [Pseudonocardia thermophila]SHK01993.1 NAD(P)-dependent dehydrogenase, short-chain alcohol dehydrogenase family [Pseudonocardia thermophila]